MASRGLPPERAGVEASPDLLAWRAGLDAAVAGGMFRVDPAPDEITLGGVRALRFASAEPSRGFILPFPGGGFRLGCPEQVGPFAAALAARARMTVICPRYRLAPEHPFPAGLNDAHAAWGALQAMGDGPVILSGDSAGGGIAAGLAALTGCDTMPPAALILLSAWLDLTATNASFGINAGSDPLFSQAAAREAAALYLGDGARDHALASPALGRVDHFPPTFVNVGDGEVLADDSRTLHSRLIEAGVVTRLHIVPAMEHVAVTRGANLPGAAETLDAVVNFLNETLSPSTLANPGHLR